MKLQTIDSATIPGDALMLTVTVVEMNTVFNEDGKESQVPGDTETLPFVFRPSDRNGLSPQVEKYLREHKSGFPQDVQDWIDANLIAENA